jgi:N-acetylmuramoyl-L-alanine amidase
MTLIKDVVDCSTYAVRGLDHQLIYQMNKISPGLLVRIDDLNVKLGQSVHPWMQAPAKECLAKAIALRNKPMTINSAYRTLAGQMLLRSHFEHQRCGITAAAAPGRSNHNNASAIDIEDANGWRATLESCNWKWLGAFDAVHFDCRDANIQLINRTATIAFQQIWNLCNPKDLIPAKGDFGPITEDKLRNSPAEGFAGLAVPRILKYTHPLQVGADVEALQKAIARVGISVTIDRTFGPGLEKAVKQFQAKRNLGADGIVGGKTLRALGLSEIGSIDVADRELIAAV